MAEAKTPAPKYKYNVNLGGNRGWTVMKFTREEAGLKGLADADMIEGQEIVEETPEPEPKAKAPANKSKTASDK